MLQIFHNTHYDFQSKRRIMFIFSGVLVLWGIVSLFIGPNYSIDFEGGVQIIYRFENPIPVGEMRTALAEMGYADAEVKKVVQGEYEDLLVRIKQTAEGDVVIDKLKDELNTRFPNNPIAEELSVEQVGPKIGHELRTAAFMAIVWALLFIVIYLSWRFKFRYAIAAIAALTHDVLIVLGLFNLLRLEISLSIIAAFLTIVGYSLNDTIVVFDRIRENVKKLRAKPLFDVINISINDTLSRTVLTSGTTLLVVLVLYLFGGMVIHDFAFALLAGVIVGTYSSIFVASPILIEWNDWKPEKRKKK